MYFSKKIFSHENISVSLENSGDIENCEEGKIMVLTVWYYGNDQCQQCGNMHAFMPMYTYVNIHVPCFRENKTKPNSQLSCVFWSKN